MRRFLPLLAIPFLLSACDQNTTEPAAETPPAAEAPADTAAEAPAQEPAAAPAPAETANLDLEPITGNWAAASGNCDSPIVISPTSFEGAENTCEITGFTPGDNGSMTSAMTCQSEGETIDESVRMTPIFGPTGEGIRLEYLDRGGDPVNVFRCRG